MINIAEQKVVQISSRFHPKTVDERIKEYEGKFSPECIDRVKSLMTYEEVYPNANRPWQNYGFGIDEFKLYISLHPEYKGKSIVLIKNIEGGLSLYEAVKNLTYRLFPKDVTKRKEIVDEVFGLIKGKWFFLKTIEDCQKECDKHPDWQKITIRLLKKKEKAGSFYRWVLKIAENESHGNIELQEKMVKSVFYPESRNFSNTSSEKSAHIDILESLEKVIQGIEKKVTEEVQGEIKLALGTQIELLNNKIAELSSNLKEAQEEAQGKTEQTVKEQNTRLNNLSNEFRGYLDSQLDQIRSNLSGIVNETNTNYDALSERLKSLESKVNHKWYLDRLEYLEKRFRQLNEKFLETEEPLAKKTVVKINSKQQDNQNNVDADNGTLSKDTIIATDFLFISEEMKKIQGMVAKIADTDAKILLVGESGSGKTELARLIHQMSGRRESRFVKVECSSIPEKLFESILFGHIRGAFTGAYKDSPGLVSQAFGGTLFLDEITDLSPYLQGKFLRLVEENVYIPVGGTEEKLANVRIICAINKNPGRMLKEGKIRKDFYHRLPAIKIYLPSLDQRKNEIPSLAINFLSIISNGQVELSQEAIAYLQSCKFPGNVRELMHKIESAYYLRQNDILYPADLTTHKEKELEEVEEEKLDDDDGLSELEKLEKSALLIALKDNDWSQKNAAVKLKISKRVVHYLCQKYGITHPRWGRYKRNK